MAGIRLIAKTANNTNGRTEYQCTRFNSSNEALSSLIFVKLLAASCGESTANKITEMTNAGIVVHSTFLIGSNKSTLTIIDAKLVVSESGDILSPKNAPDTTAPAVISTDKPSAELTLTNATPSVAAVVSELPMLIPIIAVTMKTIAKKNFPFTVSIAR